jgi:hypothetical protein
MFVMCLVALTATNADAGFWLNGRYYAKGVQCDGEATVKNIDKNMVSIACSVDPPAGGEFEIILVCQNPGGNISTGRAFVDNLAFEVGLGTAQLPADRKGKVTFSTVVNGDGITPPQHPNCPTGDAYCNCDFDDACRTLRGFCPNDNWLPIDATPINMQATVATYYCNNVTGKSCPCDPNVTNPSDPFVCATATGIAKSPWSFDWSVTNNQLVPAALEVSECTLPNPDTWRFGENRQYDCTVILDQST